MEWNLVETGQERKKFQNFFFSNKMTELWFVFCNNEFGMIMLGIYEFQISLTLKLIYFEKWEKWDELSEFLKITGVELWCGYVWTTVMLCDIRKCFVDVFEHERLVFSELFGKDGFWENRWTLSKWDFMIG